MYLLVRVHADTAGKRRIRLDALALTNTYIESFRSSLPCADFFPLSSDKYETIDLCALAVPDVPSVSSLDTASTLEYMARRIALSSLHCCYCLMSRAMP